MSNNKKTWGKAVSSMTEEERADMKELAEQTKARFGWCPKFMARKAKVNSGEIKPDDYTEYWEDYNKRMKKNYDSKGFGYKYIPAQNSEEHKKRVAETKPYSDEEIAEMKEKLASFM